MPDRFVFFTCDLQQEFDDDFSQIRQDLFVVLWIILISKPDKGDNLTIDFDVFLIRRSLKFYCTKPFSKSCRV